MISVNCSAAATMNSRARSDSDSRRFRATFVTGLRKFVAFLFSQVGLSVAVIGYAVLGALVFRYLERPNEINECAEAETKYTSRERGIVNDLNQLLEARLRGDVGLGGDVAAEIINETMRRRLRDFRESTLEIGNFMTGSDCQTLSKEGDASGIGKWTWSGSLLFSVTVFTTIGYGNITPRTFWGRMVLIAYAMLGIPLMLTWLSNVGHGLGSIFRVVYSIGCCCGCCRQRPRAAPGDGGVIDAKDGREHPSTGTMMPTQVANVRKTDTNEVTLVAPVDTNAAYKDALLDTYCREKITVPLTVTMGLNAGYLLIGAGLFGLWDDWDPMTASYYSFVTISTIGFGDVVPGSANFSQPGDHWKMFGASMYVLMGMALLSMSFDLVRDEFAQKVRRISHRFGFDAADNAAAASSAAAVPVPADAARSSV